MFPSAVTALTGARRSRSPERAGRERARLGERETEGARGARGERASGGRRRSAQWPAWGRGRAASARVRGRGGVRARGHGSGPEAASRRGGRGGRTGRARGGGGARPRGPGALCGAGDPRRRGGKRMREVGWRERAHAREVAEADSGTGAELHPEAWTSWRVQGGVRARLPRTGSGKEPARTE